MRRKSTTRPSIKKSMNQELEEKDLLKLIEEKDQIIRKLQFKVEKLQRNQEDYMKLNSGEGGMATFYKEKLELEIKQNERAFDLFLSISHRMLKLSQMLFSPSELSDDSSQVQGLLRMMGDVNLSSEMSVSQQSSSFYQNMDGIQLQVNKRFDELQLICDKFHKNFLKTQKEYRDVDQRMKELKINYLQEVRAVKNEVRESRSQKQHLKNLLSKLEKQRNDLLARIGKALDSKKKKQIQNMSRQQLIDYIKRLMFKISQLQTTKTEVIKQNKKIKTTDYENYKKILNQIKEVKQMSRLGRSLN